MRGGARRAVRRSRECESRCSFLSSLHGFSLDIVKWAGLRQKSSILHTLAGLSRAAANGLHSAAALTLSHAKSCMERQRLSEQLEQLDAHTRF